jgi:DNA-binding NtrC family response regulator
MANILIVDDFKRDQEVLAATFRAAHDVRCAGDLDETARLLEDWWPDVALVDAMFPNKRYAPPSFQAGSFLELVEAKAVAYTRAPQIIIVSGQNDAAKKFDEVRQWLTYGRVADVIPKGTADLGMEFFRAVVQMRVETLLDRQRWRSVQDNAESASEWFRQLGIITCSPRVLGLRDSLIAASRSSACVLLSGPNGCGKELFAKAIHSLGRPGKPFLEQDCSAISIELFEAEMFGIQRYGNSQVFIDKPGLFYAAADGTIHLDEIQDLEPKHQAKIRHVLEEQKFRRVGGTMDIPFRGKVVCATNVDLWQRVEEKAFRQDLYFRVARFPILIPALADRMEDVPYLAEYFLSNFVDARIASGDGCPAIGLHPKALSLLSAYNWPGNVRQLKNLVEVAAEYATLRSPRPGGKVEIGPELLEKCSEKWEPAPLGRVAPSVVVADEFLAPNGVGVPRWADLTEEKACDAIVGLLSDSGKAQFETLLNALRPRARGAGSDSPGRDNQDPATIHCLKGLLYILLHPDHKVSVQELKDLFQLASWDSGKKVMKILAGDTQAVPAFAPFISLPPAHTRQVAVLLPGILASGR